MQNESQNKDVELLQEHPPQVETIDYPIQTHYFVSDPTYSSFISLVPSTKHAKTKYKLLTSFGVTRPSNHRPFAFRT